MLRELHISNLAVIADARIELAPGLNCFTGATGAGKSLVIGAIEVLLGLRGGGDMLRPGTEEARVSGVFEVRDAHTLEKIAEAADAPVGDDGGQIILTRRLYSSGRSSVSLSGHPITLGMLKQIAEHLVDVHGQHDHQFLLKPANQLEVLDQFGQLGPLASAYHESFRKAADATRRIDELSASQTLRRQQLELFRFQADEIDAAALDPAEFDKLTSRASILQNLEKLQRDAAATHSALYEADGSVLERLRMMSAVIAECAAVDPALKTVSAALGDATIALNEVAFDLSRYLGKLDLDPGELAEVTDRLNTINRIVAKYGDARGGIAGVIAYRKEIGEKIAELERATDDLSALRAELRPMLATLEKQGTELTKKRRAAADRLAPLIQKQLAELGMERAVFRVDFSPAAEAIAGNSLPASPSGFDQVEFIAQTNPGQLALPLRKIASGGELSRIMLALKGILAQSDRVSVLVFDEIDANVGGRLGAVIGGKLRGLAAHHQVLCITHLPQIASYADRHITVRKEVAGQQTRTTIRLIDGEARIAELAEMIGGRQITEVTRAQAAELLSSAAKPNGKAGSPIPPLPRRSTAPARSKPARLKTER
jgi:DNA repair protein RecN (Recombination protein N)